MDLPLEIIVHILSFLSYRQTIKASAVCKALYEGSRDDWLWKGYLFKLMRSIDINPDQTDHTLPCGMRWIQYFECLQTGYINLEIREESQNIIAKTYWAPNKIVEGGDIAVCVGPFDRPERGLLLRWFLVQKKLDFIKFRSSKSNYSDESFLETFMSIVETFKVPYEWGAGPRTRVVLDCTHTALKRQSVCENKALMDGLINMYMRKRGVAKYRCMVPSTKSPERKSSNTLPGRLKRRINTDLLLPTQFEQSPQKVARMEILTP